MTPEEIARTMPEWPETGIYSIPIDLHQYHNYNDQKTVESISSDAHLVLFVADIGAALDYTYKRDADLVGLVVRDLKKNSLISTFHDEDDFGHDNEYIDIVDAANGADVYKTITRAQMSKLLDMVGIQINLDELLKPTRQDE